MGRKKKEPRPIVLDLGLVLQTRNSEVAFFKSLSELTDDQRKTIKGIRVCIGRDDKMSVNISTTEEYTIFKIGTNYK